MKTLLTVLTAVSFPANAYQSTEVRSNGVIAVTCERITGKMLSMKTLVTIPEGVEIQMLGACDLKA